MYKLQINIVLNVTNGFKAMIERRNIPARLGRRCKYIATSSLAEKIHLVYNNLLDKGSRKYIKWK